MRRKILTRFVSESLMRPFLFKILRCPACQGALNVEAFVEDRAREEVIDGVLTCGCGSSYPIVNTIPRMLPDAYELFPGFVATYRARLVPRAPAGGSCRARTDLAPAIARTRRSFGYQWTVFSEMSCDFTENFWNYLSPATPELLRGKVGLDVGCGFGRHLYHAAHHCAAVVGLDLSQAIDSAHRNTRHFDNVHLVQGSIYALPFAKSSFDVLYTIGVLHHLPDPARGIRNLLPLLCQSGVCFVWLYSKQRRVVNCLLECVRLVTTRLPHPLVWLLALLGAVIDQYVFIWPYRGLRRLPGLGLVIERLTPARIKLYTTYPFQVIHADWFDRLAAPIRSYFDEDEVRELMIQAGYVEVQVSPTGLYGWRACGIRHSGEPSPVSEVAVHG